MKFWACVTSNAELRPPKAHSSFHGANKLCSFEFCTQLSNAYPGFGAYVGGHGRVYLIAFRVLAVFELGGAVFILVKDRQAGRLAVMLAIWRCAATRSVAISATIGVFGRLPGLQACGVTAAKQQESACADIHLLQGSSAYYRLVDRGDLRLVAGR